MNDYFSGDVGKCPFATAAHARKMANTQVSIAALKQFARLVLVAFGGLAAIAAVAAVFTGTVCALLTKNGKRNSCHRQTVRPR